MNRLFALVTLVLLTSLLSVRAEGPDDQYVRIYNVIQEADAFNTAGQVNQALAKYLEAQTALQRFQKFNAEWNSKVVNFRLSYLASRVKEVSARVPTIAAMPAGHSGTNAAAAGARTNSAVAEAQVNSLRDQVRQMQVDKIMLEAKLKESLAAQPAAVDPRELSKAEEKIKSLQKENALLKVNITQVQATASPSAADTASTQQAQRALADSNRKLAEQTEKANNLALEKTALQQKLDSLLPTAWNASALDATKKALEQATRQLTEQKDLAAKAAVERDQLQAKIAGLTTESEAATAIRAENQILKKQLADLRASAPSPGKIAEAARQLAAAQAQIAALQSDKDILRLEKMALEGRVKLLAIAANRAPTVSKPEDLNRIKQLERDRDELQKRLETVSKDLASRNNKAVASRVLEMENQMAALRARLDVFEARAIPYNTEELALFKRPDINLAAKEKDPNAGRKPTKALPSGAASTVADAQRFFAEHQYEKAEEKYLQVLKQDDKNVPTLANLATIQIERNRYAEAEKHIKQAVALAPEDAYSWLVLGQLKFRQEKYDEALDALSRAAKLDPQDAQIQNYLGITLSQKGMRGPAETALRKAIQLDPGNASAHHNLAVVYLTQQPPLTELAKWHYQKALAAGHPANPEVEKMFTAQQPTTSASTH